MRVYIARHEEIEYGDHQQEDPALILALEQLASNIIVRAVAQPQQYRRIDGMRDHDCLNPGHPAQPRQVHRPRAEHVLDHLAHESADVFARRRVVKQHPVFDERVVRFCDPSRVVLIEMHLEDVDAHLVRDDEKSDDEENAGARFFEPLSESFPQSPSVPQPRAITGKQRTDSDRGQRQNRRSIYPEERIECRPEIDARNNDHLEYRPEEQLAT